MRVCKLDCSGAFRHASLFRYGDILTRGKRITSDVRAKPCLGCSGVTAIVLVEFVALPYGSSCGNFWLLFDC